jgi:hypothetical protein
LPSKISFQSFVLAASAYAKLPMDLVLKDKTIATATPADMVSIIVYLRSDIIDAINQMLDDGRAEMLPAGAHVILDAADDRREIVAVRYNGAGYWVSIGVINKAIGK